ncbi:olfactory receptor 4B13-like [Maylandia zebra]|uniref:olfactory receptor 4B13-like n=1 Tax=Maylandia zebra TaxID=106582 RepID=UPI00403D14D3
MTAVLPGRREKPTERAAFCPAESPLVDWGEDLPLYKAFAFYFYPIVYFILFIVLYCVILFFNISLVLLIVLDESLHEPMYILLSSFCINALYGTTGFYPKFLSDLLSSSHRISYEGCLLQAFIAYSFSFCDLSILTVMAFDRYLAICRPLHYHSFMTKRRLSQLVCFSWLTPFCVFAINVLFTARLNAYVIIVIYHFHWLFIIWTYIYIIKTCVRSREDRVKFTQTCVPHLTSVIINATVLAFDAMYLRFGSRDLSQSLKNFIALEFLIIPPVMNPLMYGFKLTKIRNRILSLIYLKGK